MKRSLGFLVTLALATLCVAQSQPEQALYERLTARGVDAGLALKEILAAPQSSSATILYTAAGIAYRDHQIADAGYLFYVARFRARFDLALFPPTGTGGDSPTVLFAALQQQLGTVVNPALLVEPKVLAGVLERVKAWSPEVPPGYTPGWEFSGDGSRERADTVLRDAKAKFLEGMGGICTLLQDEAYFAAFRTAQDFNLKQGGERPTQAAFDVAMKTMERIEREKGIQGIASTSRR